MRLRVRPAESERGSGRLATGSPGDLDVLLFGGTGRLGAAITQRLVAAGHRVTVFARPQSSRERLAGVQVDYLTGDLTEAGSVTAAVAGRRFDVAIDATSKDRERERFYAEAMSNMLAGLQYSGIRQFILHGSVGAGDNRGNFPDVPFDSMLTVMEDKGAAERLLKDSGLPYTIIRNGRVLAVGTPASGQARLAEDKTVLGTVSREDLADLTMYCLGRAACIGKVFHAVDDSRDAAF